MKSSIENIVYELPHELQKDLVNHLSQDCRATVLATPFRPLSVKGLIFKETETPKK